MAIALEILNLGGSGKVASIEIQSNVFERKIQPGVHSLEMADKEAVAELQPLFDALTLENYLKLTAHGEEGIFKTDSKPGGYRLEMLELKPDETSSVFRVMCAVLKMD